MRSLSEFKKLEPKIRCGNLPATTDEKQKCIRCPFVSDDARWCSHHGQWIDDFIRKVATVKGKKSGCSGCGKTIKNIIHGYGSLITENVIGIELIKSKYTDDRLKICRQCSEQTWMKKTEYIKWLQDNGTIILKNLNNLILLPLLPKYEREQGRRNLFCRLCKCFIPAKARVEKEKCPLDKWP